MYCSYQVFEFLSFLNTFYFLDEEQSALCIGTEQLWYALSPRLITSVRQSELSLCSRLIKPKLVFRLRVYFLCFFLCFLFCFVFHFGVFFFQFR